MQQPVQELIHDSAQEPTALIHLRVSPDGMPQPEAPSADDGLLVNNDFLAAMSCALYSNALEMAEVFSLGALHSIECHLSSGAVVIHRAAGCGDLWIHEEHPSPSASA